MFPGKYARVMTRAVDPEAQQFPYEQVAGFIAADINSGALPVGRRIPSEADLIATYGIARDTARRAVRHLRELGYVETRPQRGTFVIERKGTADTDPA